MKALFGKILLAAAFLILFAGCMKVTGTDPADGSTDVPVNKTVRITLSKDAKPATVNSATLAVTDNTGKSVQGDIICSGKEIMFTPEDMFVHGMKYYVSLGRDIRSKIGLRLAAYSFSFTAVSSSINQPAPLHVLSVSPADGSTNIAFDAVIRIRFDAPVLASSVNSRSMVVSDDEGNSVDGSFAFTGDMKSFEFRPSDTMSFMKRYKVLLKNTILNNEGIRLEDDFVFSFTTESEKKWDTSAAIQTGYGTIGGTVDIAMDNNGDAIAVWQGIDKGDDFICRCEYRDGVWGPVEKVSVSGNHTADPKVVMNDRDEALIIWTECYETYLGEDVDPVYTQEIYSSSYKGGEWTAPELISGIENCISIAFGNNGEALLAGYIFNDIYNIEGLGIKEYRNGSWNLTPMKTLDTDEFTLRNVQLEIDDSGDAIVAWLVDDYNECPSYVMLRENHIWNEPEEIKTDGLNNLIPVLDIKGNPVADDILNGIYSWSVNSERVNDVTGINLIKRDISEENGYHFMKKGDSIFLLWREFWKQYGSTYDKNRIYTYSAEYRDGSWSVPSSATNLSICELDIWNLARPFRIDIDGRGNAVMVWPQRDDQSGTFYFRDYGYYRIFMNECRSGIWNYKTVQLSTTGRYSDFPKVTMDNKGHAVIIWQEWDGEKWQIFRSCYR